MPAACAWRNKASTAAWFPEATAMSKSNFKSASAIPPLGAAATGIAAGAVACINVAAATGTPVGVDGIGGMPPFGVATTVGAGASGGGGGIKRCIATAGA